MTKKLAEFGKDKNRKDGFNCHCKECCKTARLLYLGKNKARVTVAYPLSKVCFACQVEKPTERFGKNKTNKDGLQRCCKDCSYVIYRRSLYGVTKEWYQATLKSQEHACAVCKTDTPGGRGEWHIDHEHVKGWKEMQPAERMLYVRGLLCYSCNHALGLFKESVKSLESAVVYLNKHSLRKFEKVE
jgi:hypothetical protein